jgi:hypothetical protein
MRSKYSLMYSSTITTLHDPKPDIKGRDAMLTHNKGVPSVFCIGVPLDCNGVTCFYYPHALLIKESWVVASAYSNGCPGSNGRFKHDSCDLNSAVVPLICNWSDLSVSYGCAFISSLCIIIHTYSVNRIQSAPYQDSLNGLWSQLILSQHVSNRTLYQARVSMPTGAD